MLAKDDFLLLQSGLDPKKGGNGEESGQQPSALTIPHDPPRNGALSSDPWQKIHKTAANGTLEKAPASSPCGLWLLIGAFRLLRLRGIKGAMGTTLPDQVGTVTPTQASRPLGVALMAPAR